MIAILIALILYFIAFSCFVTAFWSTLNLAQFLSAQNVSDNQNFTGIVAPFSCSGFFIPLLTNMLYILLFMIQHTAMAHSTWKNFIRSLHLHMLERSIYVFFSAVGLQMLIQQWSSSPAIYLWFIDTSIRPKLAMLFTIIHVLAWLRIYASAFTMDPAELVGLKQVYYYLQGLPEPIQMKSSRAQRLYRHARHPASLSFLVVLWAHPIMSLSRLYLAVLWTGYVIFCYRLDDKDRAYVAEMVDKKRRGINGDLYN